MRVLISLIALVLSFCQAVAESPNTNLPPLVPGTLDWDYVGNSCSDFAVDAENGLGRWVQNFVDEIEVTPDGTVIVTCDWDKAGAASGSTRTGGPAEPRWARTTAGAVRLGLFGVCGGDCVYAASSSPARQWPTVH